MVERIRTLLQSRQLTPTQFADAIGIARPIVSHILSGRNKPSLEVVQKIIGAFPDLSLPWLLSGIGPMLGAAVASDSTLLATAPAQPFPEADAAEGPVKRIRTAPAKTSATTAAVESHSAPVVEPLFLTEPAVTQASAGQIAATVQPLPVAFTAQSHEVVQKTATPDISPLAALAEPGKKIKRIVIFYQDGTFGDYQPE